MSDTTTAPTQAVEIGQHRVTTHPIVVTDWKGDYVLQPGEGFTITDLYVGNDGEWADIDRDGLLSGSMGGSMAQADVLNKSTVG